MKNIENYHCISFFYFNNTIIDIDKKILEEIFFIFVL